MSSETKSNSPQHETPPATAPGGSGEPAPRRRTLAFAAQELRLISALVVLIATGLVLAQPFVLSI